MDKTLSLSKFYIQQETQGYGMKYFFVMKVAMPLWVLDGSAEKVGEFIRWFKYEK